MERYNAIKNRLNKNLGEYRSCYLDGDEEDAFKIEELKKTIERDTISLNCLLNKEIDEKDDDFQAKLNTDTAKNLNTDIYSSRLYING